jgi:hypothetical protein
LTGIRDARLVSFRPMTGQEAPPEGTAFAGRTSSKRGVSCVSRQFSQLGMFGHSFVFRSGLPGLLERAVLGRGRLGIGLRAVLGAGVIQSRLSGCEMAFAFLAQVNRDCCIGGNLRVCLCRRGFSGVPFGTLNFEWRSYRAAGRVGRFVSN